MIAIREKKQTATSRAPFEVSVAPYTYGISGRMPKSVMEDALSQACDNIRYVDRMRLIGYSEPSFLPNVVKEGIIPFVTKGRYRIILSRRKIKGHVVPEKDYKKDLLCLETGKENEVKSTTIFNDFTPVGGNLKRVDWFVSSVAQYDLSEERKFLGLVINVYNLSSIDDTVFADLIQKSVASRATNDEVKKGNNDSTRDKPKIYIQRDIVGKLGLKPTYQLTCNDKGKITS